MAKNIVPEGLYKGQPLDCVGSCILTGSAAVRKGQIESYRIITWESHKSGASMLVSGAVGMALPGHISALAAFTARNAKTYLISVKWSSSFLRSKGLPDGYKALIQTTF